MSELSKQYHSVIFGTKNTWDDWHLVPSSRPVINPPGVKTDYLDIPGADGSLDYTEALSGIKYKDRVGNLEFIVMNGYANWYDLYDEIMAYLHGRNMKVVLEDDPRYYYQGRLSLNQWKSEKSYSKIVIDYVLDPYKIPQYTSGDNYDEVDPENPAINNPDIIENPVSTTDWLWDELFGNVIYYGTFDVQRTKSRNIINSDDKEINVAATCTSAMTIIFGEQTIELPSGTTENAFVLQPGDNIMEFQGDGRVVLDYYTGRKI